MYSVDDILDSFVIFVSKKDFIIIYYLIYVFTNFKLRNIKRLISWLWNNYEQFTVALQARLLDFPRTQTKVLIYAVKKVQDKEL